MMRPIVKIEWEREAAFHYDELDYAVVEVLRQVFDWAWSKGKIGYMGVVGDKVYSLMSAMRGPDDGSAASVEGSLARDLKCMVTEKVRRAVMGDAYQPCCDCAPPGSLAAEGVYAAMREWRERKREGGGSWGKSLDHVVAHLEGAVGSVESWLRMRESVERE